MSEGLMQQKAVVVRHEGDHVCLRSQRLSACGGCAGESSCSTLGSWNRKDVDMLVPNTLHADVGDTVVLGLPARALLQASWRAYGLPLFAFVGLAVLAESLGLAAWQAAFLGLSAMLWVYWRLSKTRDSVLLPEMLAVEKAYHADIVIQSDL